MNATGHRPSPPGRKGPRPTYKEVDDAFDQLEAEGKEPTCRNVEGITRGTTEVVRELVNQVKADRRLAIANQPISEECILAIKKLAQDAYKRGKSESLTDLHDAEEKSQDDKKRLDEKEAELAQLNVEADQLRLTQLTAEKLLEVERADHETTRKLSLCLRDELSMARHQLDGISAELASAKDRVNELERSGRMKDSDTEALHTKVASLADQLQTERIEHAATKKLLAIGTASLEAEQEARAKMESNLRSVIAERDYTVAGVAPLEYAHSQVEAEVKALRAKLDEQLGQQDKLARENGVLRYQLKLILRQLQSFMPHAASDFEIDLKGL